MNYWLIKSEPNTYSLDDLKKEKQTCWSGVRNYAARIHLRAMKTGDLTLFYHSGENPPVVGIAKIVKEAYPDPTTSDTQWSAVDVAYHQTLKNPVTLQQIKKEKRLAQIPLIRIGRLSVMPLSEKEFDCIIELSE